MRGVAGRADINRLFMSCPASIKTEEQREDNDGPCLARAGSMEWQGAESGDDDDSKEPAPAAEAKVNKWNNDYTND